VNCQKFYGGKPLVCDNIFYSKEFIEFSTNIGCPVNCSKYCPQDVTVKRYVGKRFMSFEEFKAVIDKIPTDVGIVFSGFSEPFVNPDCLRMIKYVSSLNYSIVIFTTLFGVTKQTLEELIKMKYAGFCLHLPDGNVTRFQITEEYKDNVFSAMQRIPNISVVLMNSLFESNDRENIVRGILPKPKHIGWCRALSTFQPVILPNADAYLCCMDFGLWHNLGNMITDGYDSVKKNYRNQKPFELCKYCSRNTPYYRHIGRIFVDFLRNRRLPTGSRRQPKEV
jgi:hypothetical protein